MPSNSGYTISIESILREAKFRWLKGYEVLCILQNFQQYDLQLSPAAPVDPQSGSLFLFNKRLVKFRKDGVNWRKQKDGKTVRESHEKLKVGGIKVLSCCYTRSADNPAFQRRIYWLLDGDQTTVLVHYLTMDKDISTREDDCNLEFSALEDFDDSPSQRRRNIRSTYHLRSGSNEEEEEIGSQSGSDFSEEDEEWCRSKTFEPSSSSAAFVSPEDGRIMDFVNSIISTNDSNTSLSHPKYPPHIPQTPTDFYQETTSTTATVGRLAKITDYSPEWDYLEGGTRMLILGPDFHSGLTYCCMFDHTEVPAELVQDGVLRCTIPNHYNPGFVSFCITRGNFMVFSELYRFEFRSKDSPNDLFQVNDGSFKIRIVERLERLEREANSANAADLSSDHVMGLMHSLDDKHLTEEQVEENFVTALGDLMKAVDNADIINAQDRDGFTLLHYASALRYQALASCLIMNGANVNISDKRGCTPFQWALKNRDQQMIKTLVDYVELKVPCDLSPPIRGSPTIERIISGMDGLGIQRIDSPSILRVKEISEWESSSLRKKDGCSSPRSPRSPRTPHQGIKARQIMRPGEEEDEEFKIIRSRRVERAEDDSRRRAAKARDTRIAQRRK